MQKNLFFPITAFDDYVNLDDGLTFQPSTRNVCVSIEIIDDLTEESSSEVFNVVLSTNDPGVNASDSASIQIIDNDNGKGHGN